LKAENLILSLPELSIYFYEMHPLRGDFIHQQNYQHGKRAIDGEW